MQRPTEAKRHLARSAWEHFDKWYQDGSDIRLTREERVAIEDARVILNNYALHGH